MFTFTKKRFAILFSIITVAALIMTGCGTNQSATNQTAKEEAGQEPKQDVIKIGYPTILAMAPAIIAEKKKMMEEQGLEAEYYEFANGPDLNKALSAGELDFAYTGIPVVVNWASRGAEIEVISKVGDGEFGLITKEDSQVTEPNDLAGKTIGNLGKGTGSDILLRGFFLPENELTESDVSLMDMKMPLMEQAVANGTIDAALTAEPFVTFAELRGLKVVEKLPEPAVVVIVRKSFAEENADLVEKFVQGHIASVAYLNEKPEEAAAVLAETFNLPEIKSTGKTWTATEVMEKALANQHYEAEFSEEDFAFYQELADANHRLELIDEPFDIQSIFNLTWVE
ncbi:ABC transporter substrate-binding protein [Halalkalibacter nanhaiisediminis]|uniref:NitT/TauT family transport system substrate-binding protein n=1 Tax=Halalkalibacter nanhaiisediminis TaxID=688079 RepID=A0A562QDA4_9BACI|nr:ABC transporter substrate-binding protein [Halalkalibacter nanhaiisediminis]TWI54689.1 NitT/TauT family transport system substrate-binding protein [Halalkalibacter nanhaiisediminis]